MNITTIVPVGQEQSYVNIEACYRWCNNQAGWAQWVVVLFNFIIFIATLIYLAKYKHSKNDKWIVLMLFLNYIASLILISIQHL